MRRRAVIVSPMVRLTTSPAEVAQDALHDDVTQSKRQAQHPLPDRHSREDVAHEMRRALGHPTPATIGTHRTRLARERHETFRVARVAAKAREASGPHSARSELSEFTLDEGWHAAGLLRGTQEGGEVRTHHLMQDRVLGGARTVGANARGGTRSGHPPSCAAGSPAVDPYEYPIATGTGKKSRRVGIDMVAGPLP
jgi:hypothetical protein